MKFSFRITMCSMLIGLASYPHHAWAQEQEEVMVYGTRYIIVGSSWYYAPPPTPDFSGEFTSIEDNGIQELISPEGIMEKLAETFGCSTTSIMTREAVANAWFKAMQGLAISGGLWGEIRDDYLAGATFYLSWPDGSVGAYVIGDPNFTLAVFAEVECTNATET